MDKEKLIQIARDYEAEFKTYILVNVFYDYPTMKDYVDNFINEFIPQQIEDYPEDEEDINKYSIRIQELDLDKLEEEYQVCLTMYRLS